MCAIMVVDRAKARHAAELTTAENQVLQEDRSIPEKGIATFAELEREFAKIHSEVQSTANLD